MKKYIPLSIAILIILFLILKITSSDRVAEQEIVETDDASLINFEKNSSCFMQKQSILEEIENNKDKDVDETLVEVFYSDQFNSCLYVSKVIDKVGTSMKRLMDYRTAAGTNPILSCIYVHDKFAYDNYTTGSVQTFSVDGCASFDGKVQDLKNGVKDVVLSEEI